jgi:hypothetical protein
MTKFVPHRQRALTVLKNQLSLCFQNVRFFLQHRFFRVPNGFCRMNFATNFFPSVRFLHQNFLSLLWRSFRYRLKNFVKSFWILFDFDTGYYFL